MNGNEFITAPNFHGIIENGGLHSQLDPTEKQRQSQL